MLQYSYSYGSNAIERIATLEKWLSDHVSCHGESVYLDTWGSHVKVIPDEVNALMLMHYSHVGFEISKVKITTGEGWKFTSVLWRQIFESGYLFFYDWFLECDDEFAVQFKLACL